MGLYRVAGMRAKSSKYQAKARTCNFYVILIISAWWNNNGTTPLFRDRSSEFLQLHAL
jgi:hypothetical protein